MTHLLEEYDLPGLLGRGAYLARVVSVNDPDNRNRVQLRIYNVDGVTDQDAPVWARVAVPFSGGKRGAFLFRTLATKWL